MWDFWFDLGISVILTAIRAALKNPEKAEMYKRALMKVRSQIDLLYPPEEI